MVAMLGSTEIDGKKISELVKSYISTFMQLKKAEEKMVIKIT